MIVLQRFFKTPQFTEDMHQDFQVLAGKQKYLLGNVLERIQDRLSRTMEVNKVNEIYSDPFIRERLWKALEQNIISAIDWNIVTQNIKQHDGAKIITKMMGENIYKRKFIWQGVKGIFGDGVMNNIAQEALRQGSEILKVDETRKVLLENGQDLALQAIEDSEIKKKSYDFLLAIKNDQELHKYVKEKYGNAVWDSILESLEDSAKNEKDSIMAMKTSLEDFAKKWLEFIVLNEKKDGPNPIMLLAVKEAISGQKPMVMCIPGQGEKVTAGYEYELRIDNARN